MGLDYLGVGVWADEWAVYLKRNRLSAWGGWGGSQYCFSLVRVTPRWPWICSECEMGDVKGDGPTDGDRGIEFELELCYTVLCYAMLYEAKFSLLEASTTSFVRFESSSLGDIFF